MSDATSQSTSCMECGCPGVDVHYEGCPALIPGNKLAGKDAEIARLRAEVERYHAGCCGRDVEILKLEDCIRDLQPVVDAAVAWDANVSIEPPWSIEEQNLHDAVRALDGEPCHDCVDGITPKDGNAGGTRYACPTCGGCGYLMTDDPRKDQDCPTCGGCGLIHIEQSKYVDHSKECPDCGWTGRKE